MVREGEYPRRELAVCCRVEVVNGARGERFCSDSFTSFTTQVPLLPASIIFLTNFSSRGSSEHSKVIFSFLGVSKNPNIFQYFSGIKARISRSRSIIIRSAGDCTRPAERPYRTFFQISPER